MGASSSCYEEAVRVENSTNSPTVRNLVVSAVAIEEVVLNENHTRMHKPLGSTYLAASYTTICCAMSHVARPRRFSAVKIHNISISVVNDSSVFSAKS